MIPDWIGRLSGKDGSETERRLRAQVEQLQRQVEELSAEKVGQKECCVPLKHLASFPEQHPTPIIEVAGSGQIKYLNPAAKAAFPDLITRGNGHDLFAGLDAVVADLERSGLRSAVREATAGGQVYRETIHYLPETRLLRIYLKDITEQRAVERMLKETQDRLALITENMTDLIAMTDITAVYQYVSPSCKKITGFAPEEMIGKPAFLFIHPGDIMRMAEAIREHLKTGEPGRIELRARHADGHYVWIEAAGDLLRDEKGKIIGSVLTSRNIDDRKAAEEQLKKLLLEKEMLLKEVHHRTKNNLQVISSLLNLQSSYITDERCLGVFRDSQNRLRSMSLVHEKLYRSSSGSKIDFGEYIGNVVDNLYYSYSVSSSLVSLKIDVEGVFLDTDTAITCGLLVNEIISNSLKHAFPGRAKGSLWVEMRRDGDSYLLVAGDDGIGLPEGVNQNNTGTLGLQLITSLVSQLNGTVELRRDRGTQYSVRFKAKDE